MSQRKRELMLGIPYAHDWVDPKPAALDFDSSGEVAVYESVKVECFRVGDSPDLHVLPWPFRATHFALPAKGVTPLDGWVLEGLTLNGEEQVMGFLPLVGLINTPLALRGCPTGSKVVMRLHNEAATPRRCRISLRGSRL